MQPSSFELAGVSILTPALLAGAIVTAFFACHYRVERRNRQEFLRWWDNSRPKPLTDPLADPPTPGNHRWTHPSGLYGAGTAAHGSQEASVSAGSFLRKHARGYALAILTLGLALLLRLWLEPVLQGRSPYGFFCAAVLFTAMFAGIWETLLVLILGFLAAEWFIIEPLHSLMIDGTRGWLGAVVYFILGLGIVWFKRSEAAAEQQALASDIASIDRLKELEQERALLAVLAQIVKTLPEAVLSLTNEGCILTWNAAAENRFGFSEQVATGQPLALVLPPEGRAEAERMLQTVRQSALAQQWQTTLNHKDGSRVPVSLTAAPARDAAGKVVGFSLVVLP